LPESDASLIVGLGNPGKDYEETRHNLGFCVVEHLAERYKTKFVKDKTLEGLLAAGEIEHRKVYLFLPLTYMNNSGVAVKKVVEAKKIALENVLVVCDDINLTFSQLRLRASGSDGGHKGLSSLIGHLRFDGFARLRLGIHRPSQKKDVVDYVLGGFNKKEKELLSGFITKATDCCVVWLTKGVAKAMSDYNKK